MCYFLIIILIKNMWFKCYSITNLISQAKHLIIRSPHIHLTEKYIYILLRQNNFICKFLTGNLEIYSIWKTTLYQEIYDIF